MCTKGKNIYLNFIAFCVLLKKDSSFKKKIVLFLSLCAGCETSEYSFVFINDDHLSAAGKWMTEERVRRGRRRKGKKYDRRKQFETVAVANREGRMGREKGNCIQWGFHRRRVAG